MRWAGIVSLPDGARLFLKRDRSKGWWEYIKYRVLPSRGRSEWLTATLLEARDVSIPKPMGWLERRRGGLVRESYYLSEAVGSGVTCLEEAAPLTTRAAIVELAGAVRKIQDAALFHRDFHAGNFLSGMEPPLCYRSARGDDRQPSLCEAESVDDLTPFALSQVPVDKGTRGRFS